MTREKLYETLSSKMQAAIKRANNGVEEMFDPTMWIGFITAIVTAIRGCRSPETAKANIRDGSAVSYGVAMRVMRDKGYKGRERRTKAWELVQEGKGLSDEELDGLINDSQDVPQPPPVDGGFWPQW